MNPITEFVPAKGYPSLKKMWKGQFTTIIIAIVVFAGPLLAFRLPAVICLGIPIIPVGSVLLTAMRSKYPIKVIISGADGTFTYRFLNAFGKERDTVISMPTAKVNYEIITISRGHNGYRLKLYNHFFGKKISLVESSIGYWFDKEQLDQMASLIKHYVVTSNNI